MDDTERTLLYIGKYQLIKPLGKGRFGKVYEASHKDKRYALKIEDIEAEYNTIQHEAYIFHVLFRRKVSNVPSLYWYGSDDPWRFITTTFFTGSSLDDLYLKMTWEEVVHWFKCSIIIIQSIHQARIIHRDIKPIHFIKGEDEQWNLIDFGMAGHVGNIVPTELSSTVTGTPRFMSIWIHQGQKPAKRDDMISLLYIFLDLYMIHHHKVRLSWQTIKDQFPNPNNISRIELSHPFNMALMREKQWDILTEFLSTYHVPKPIFDLVHEASAWEYTSDPVFTIPD
jgi:serine/threonine protein kinase